MTKILFVFGTRPEAIKLAPVIECLNREPSEFDVRVAVTAQHRDLLDQVLEAFGIRPHYDLDVMRKGQTLGQSTSAILAALERVLNSENPDLVLVQGDTTTTFCGGLSAFYSRIPVGHVEAGLRTGDFDHPFPEEMNRVLTGRIASLHFAATSGARENLHREGVNPASIVVTGNTGIDAVLQIRDGLRGGSLIAAPELALDPNRKLVLVTAHRRESFGTGFEGIAQALVRLAGRDDVEIVYPVHPNPQVRSAMERDLGNVAHIRLIPPLGYVSFVDLMRRSYLLLTDSGGVQEEAPSLGKPVLVMRKTTERPEAVEAGTARLTGTDPDRIVAEAELLLDEPAEYARRSRIHNPFGDGLASGRIRDAIRSYMSHGRQFPRTNPAEA